MLTFHMFGVTPPAYLFGRHSSSHNTPWAARDQPGIASQLAGSHSKAHRAPASVAFAPILTEGPATACRLRHQQALSDGGIQGPSGRAGATEGEVLP